MKTIAIIGCPRSGTSWLTKVLRHEWGLDVGHEKMNKDGGVGFNLINDHFGHEVGDLVHEGVLVADVESRYPPLVHVGMFAIGDMDRAPSL